jgi:hypothetical protein
MINDDKEAHAIRKISWTRSQVLTLKHLLDFLVVFLHANTCAASAVISSTTLVPMLAAWASRRLDQRPVLEAVQWNMLRTVTLMLLGVTNAHFKICCSVLTNRFPEFDLDAFVDVVLESEEQSLLETCQCS